MFSFKATKPNIKGLKRAIKEIETNVVDKATVRALNRAMTTVKKEASLEVRKRINLPARGSSEGGKGLTPPGVDSLLHVGKATASNLSISLRASSKPISLIHFVQGDKQPVDQKGMPLGKRPRLTIKVSPGTKVTLPNSFLAKANGAYLVLARKTAQSTPTIKRAVVGLFRFLDKPEIRDRLIATAKKRFEETMQQDLKYYLGKALGKAGPK